MEGRGESCLGKKEKTLSEDTELFSNTESARESWLHLDIPPWAHACPRGPRLVVLPNALEPLGAGVSLVNVDHSGVMS